MHLSMSILELLSQVVVLNKAKNLTCPSYIGDGHAREALLATVCALEAGFETSKNPNKNKKLVPSSQEKGNQPILFTF